MPSKQPIDLVVAKGKKHLGKKEIEKRRSEEIHAPNDMIVAPDYLTKIQKEKFDAYAKQLIELNILSNLDIETLARYITANDMYETITKKMRTKKVRDDIILLEDYSKMQERYFKLSRSIANDLGLSVSSRCKLVVPKPPDPTPPKSKFDKFRSD